jgi:hypothetical protein
VLINYNAPTSQRKWIVGGTFDKNDVANSAPQNIPLVNNVAGVNQLWVSTSIAPTEPTLGNTWLVIAEYKFAVDTFELSFDTSGGTTKREQAFDQGDYYCCLPTGGGPVTAGAVIAGGGTATVPNFKGIVVDGCDVPDGKFDFTVLIRSQYSTLPAWFINTLKNLTGKMNDQPLSITYKINGTTGSQTLTFAAYELLYNGCPGKITSGDGYEFTLKFSASPGKLGGTTTTADFTVPAVNGDTTVTIGEPSLFTVGKTIYIVGAGVYLITGITGSTMAIENTGAAGNAAVSTVISSGASMNIDPTDQDPLIIGNSGPITKPGWYYLKVITKEVIVGTSRVQQPQFVIVNKVIPSANLSPLGIFS